MAYSSNTWRGDDRQGATGKVASEKSRSFSALGRNSTPDTKSNSNSLSISYGNGSTDWGPNSIWGNGSLGNCLTSRAATRESSRDGLRHVGQEEHTKGSLRPSASSVVDDPWCKWKPSTNRTTSQVEQGDGQMSQQQRSVSNTALPAFSGAPAGSRPSGMSLDTASAVATSGPKSANSSTIASRGYEAAPTVYTKHARQQDPNSRLYRDSATAGTWNSVSPTDTRRPFPPNSRTVSQPMSRNNSQQQVVPGDERPNFTRPDYGHGPQRSTQNSSRAPSISSQNHLAYNSYAEPTLEQLHMQFGHLSMNGDSRPQTSYRSSDAGFSHSFSAGTSPLTRSSMNGPRPSFGAMEDADEYDGEQLRYSGFQGALSPISTNLSAQQAYGGRFPPTPTSAEFRPGQAFANGQMAMRGFDTPNGAKSPAHWQQTVPNGMGVMQLSRPSLTAADHQALLTPQMQQLLAEQFRQHYAPMFNPYAMPGAMHLNGISPYLPMMPMPFPMADSNTPAQEITPSESIQSALLFEFKSNAKSTRYELRDIYEHVAEFSGDQHGSRFIQTKLETANSDEKSKIFDEIAPNAIQLMTDVFGNYVIQKFFEHGDQMHKKILATKMKGQVLALTNQMYGCRVVQKALDHVLVDQQAQLVRELDGHVLRCVKDQNGNHVIQKAIERCPPHVIGFIIASFQNSVQQLSVNSYGCRVIQRCLEHCDKPAKAMIMAELMDGIQSMVTDQYGNYVVQHVVERDDGEGRRNVLSIVMKNLELFSKHKFASNVVEKCLECADDIWRRGVLFKLSTDERRSPESESFLVGMIKDSYGNYVIQKLLDTINPQDYWTFIEYLQPAVSLAKRTGCGKQIQSVERKMERFARFRPHNISAHGLPLGPSQSQQPPPSPPTGPAAAFNSGPAPQSYQFSAPLHAGNYGSTGTTPPSLTADQSGQSSRMRSLDGDAVEGAHAHSAVGMPPRKGDGMGGAKGYLR